MKNSEQKQMVSVLVVDDDKVDYNAIKRGFKKASIPAPFFWAKNGYEALEILRGEHDDSAITPPYILLVDLNMPRMNGIELINRLRRDDELKKSRVVVLTTSKREEDMQAAVELGVDDYIIKEELSHNFDRLLEAYHRV